MLDVEELRLRAALFSAVRAFFHKQGFLEVDTPIRQPLILPEKHIKPLTSGSWFLQTSPEQCMKRLLARGCRKIFQICPCFRAGERGARHLEEFTMLEWYRVDGDYIDLMNDCHALVQSVLASIRKVSEFRDIVDRSCLGTIAVGREWERISVAEAFARWGTIPLGEALENQRFDEIISIDIEHRLGLQTPTFLYDYPADFASLARIKGDDAAVAERFELYIDGMELANGFSELTDGSEQRKRFGEEINAIHRLDGTSPEMPEKFLEDLERINKAAGLAFGLDRFLMLLLSAGSIEEVVSFASDDWH